MALEGACPLGVQHRPTGEEHCLGCSMCLMESKARLAALRAGVGGQGGGGGEGGGGAPPLV